jgi:hypothetical protein
MRLTIGRYLLVVFAIALAMAANIARCSSPKESSVEEPPIETFSDENDFVDVSQVGAPENEEPPKGEAEEDLKKILHGSDIVIKSISHLKKIQAGVMKFANEFNQDDINALQQLVGVTSDPQICNAEKAEQIAKFYKDWLGQTHKTELREPFRNFFIAYGLKMSAHCRTTMIDKFFAHAENQLTKKDFKDLKPLYGSGSPVDRLLSAIMRPGEILLPSVVTSVLPDLRNGTWLIEAAWEANAPLAQAKRVCRIRFQPLYAPILEPISILAQVGFRRSDIYFKANLMGFSSVESELHKWSKIIFLCELLESIKFEDETDCDDSESPKLAEVAPFRTSLEMNQKIVRPFSYFLKKAVRKFDGDDEIERIKKQILSQSWSILYQKSRAGDHWATAEHIIKIFKEKSDEEQQARLDKYLNELAHTNSKDSSKVHKTIDGLVNVMYHAGTLGRILALMGVAAALVPVSQALKVVDGNRFHCVMGRIRKSIF